MKIRMNDDMNIIAEVKKKMDAKGGYCPSKQKRTDENKCMCKEFRDLIDDPDFEGFCQCKLYYKEK